MPSRVYEKLGLLGKLSDKKIFWDTRKSYAKVKPAVLMAGSSTLKITSFQNPMIHEEELNKKS